MKCIMYYFMACRYFLIETNKGLWFQKVKWVSICVLSPGAGCKSWSQEVQMTPPAMLLVQEWRFEILKTQAVRGLFEMLKIY